MTKSENHRRYSGEKYMYAYLFPAASGGGKERRGEREGEERIRLG
jgi:hypothetical protein